MTSIYPLNVGNYSTDFLETKQDHYIHSSYNVVLTETSEKVNRIKDIVIGSFTENEQGHRFTVHFSPEVSSGKPFRNWLDSNNVSYIRRRGGYGPKDHTQGLILSPDMLEKTFNLLVKADNQFDTNLTAILNFVNQGSRP